MTNSNGLDGREIRLSDLYQEVILDHNRHPRHFGRLEHPTASAHGVNALCGDDYHLDLKKDADGVIREVGFEGQGCAISKSSASILTTAIEGKKIEEILKLKDAFLDMMLKDRLADKEREFLGKLKIFEGVKNYPVRVKCATLIWRTLEEALKDESQRKTEVTTEKETP